MTVIHNNGRENVDSQQQQQRHIEGKTQPTRKVQHLLSCYIACIYNHFTPLWGFIRRVSLSSFPFLKH